MFLGLMSGTITAFVGVGLFFVMTPLMRKLGYPLKTSIYTSLLIELYARLANTIQFIMNLDIRYDFVAWFSFFAVFGTLLGVLVLRNSVEKYCINILMLSLVTLLLITSIVVTGVMDAMSIKQDADRGIDVFYIYSY